MVPVSLAAIAPNPTTPPGTIRPGQPQRAARRFSVSAPGLRRVKGVERSRSVLASASGGSGDGNEESKEILDAFFIGRALAETVNERLGSALGELLSEVNKFDAERRDAIREFQEEVLTRAQEEMQRSANAPAVPPAVAVAAPSAPSPLEEEDAPPSLEENVDSLLAEVARTRDGLQTKNE